MRFTIFFFLALLATFGNAHFRLQFPPPRGPYDGPNEIHFCDNYPNAASNRTLFPLSGGYITLRTGHANWTYGVLLSTAQNPTTFGEFVLINGFALGSHLAGNFCLPLDLSTSNVTGLQSGQNVTLQVVFNGGDGNLYQCADVTLASNLSLASTVSCDNATVTPSHASSAGIALSPISAQAKPLTIMAGIVALAGVLLVL